MEVLHKMLSMPLLYRLAMRALGSHKTKQIHVSRYVLAKKGDRVLDVGCGVADMVSHLPDVYYLGMDINPLYIEAAQNKYSGKAEFVCLDVTTINAEQYEPFDIVLATGLLHHLSDSESLTLMQACYKLLKPSGRMVTFDGCRLPKQHPLDAWMLNNDRGKFVRSKEGYQKLASSVFPQVSINVHSDLLRVPYTVAIMELSKSVEMPETTCVDSVERIGVAQQLKH